ncbi:MAG: hypothetical protein J0M16_11765 [Gammaproteobacteria bacterium]|jgi:hypothetical protein|nr:hypothetical protein [Gammaproteobacteria bacterium]
MKIRDIIVGICLGFGAGAVAAPSATWLSDAMTMGLPQSELVRHPVDNGKYYLCWTDGLNRFGVAFRRSQLDNQLRSIPRAGRVSVATLMTTTATTNPISPWSASDEKVCWPK